MNLSAILQSLQAADPEFERRISPRRAAIRRLGRAATLAAAPVALGALLKKAYGKTTGLIDDTLNPALTLEYLQYRFYENALAQLPFPSQSARDAIATIRDHERAHVELLRQAVRSAGGNAISEPAFDFTGSHGAGGGPFAGAFSDYALFLALAQMFEDTGVRAYKGVMAGVTGSLLSATVQIHAVEARHAAYIRMERRRRSALTEGDVKPWVTRNFSGIRANPGSALIQPAYAGEQVVVQGGNNMITLAGVSGDAATEAFDEMLTKEQVAAILDPFTV